MKSQLKKLGLGMMLAVLPMMATTVSAQWTQQQQATGVVISMGDSVMEPGAGLPNIAKSVHTVAMDENGTVSGQIAALDPNTKSATGPNGLKVFFVQNGKVVNQAQTQADGSFQIQGLTEGAYSFFAAGNAGFAASGIYVTSRNWGDSKNVLETTVASSTYSGIQKMLERSVPDQVRQAVVNSNQTESANPTFVQSNHQVRLINGGITGEISSLFGLNQDVGGIQIHLIQNGKPIAQVETDSLGQFVIPDVEPGVYDFVAAGKSAMVVRRFEAIGNSGLMTQISFRKTVTKLEYALALTKDPVPKNGDGEIAFPEGANVLMERAPGTVEFAGESVGLGGASGGTAGNAGTFSSYSSGPVVRGGRFGSRIGARRLLILGGIVGGVVGGTVGNPPAESNVQVQ
jgi:hypothetical protein